MADRRRQIQQLIGSRFDLLWFPHGALQTTGGLAPGEKRPCPACGHLAQPGWTVDKFGRRSPCTTCGGNTEPSGKGGDYLTKDCGKGFVYIDRMDAHRVPVGDAETKASARPRKTVKCDACDGDGAHGNGERCNYCDGTGRRDLHVFDLAVNVCNACDGSGRRDHKTCDRCGGSGQRENADVDALTAAIERRDQAGSYHELELTLLGVVHHVNKPLLFAALTVNARQALRLLDELYLPPTGRGHGELSTFEQSLVELALAYIDTRMPAVIRVPADVRANQKLLADHRTRAKGRAVGVKATAQRDSEIRKLAREHRAAQWIAAEYGLSVSTVYAIVNGQPERERVA